jgi:hypothetical protein
MSPLRDGVEMHRVDVNETKFRVIRSRMEPQVQNSLVVALLRRGITASIPHQINNTRRLFNSYMVHTFSAEVSWAERDTASKGGQVDSPPNEVRMNEHLYLL